MAEYEISVKQELLKGLLSSRDGLANLVEEVLNQILEKQVAEALGAEKHERNEERSGYRNGYRERILQTRVGPLTLRVPQTREGSFSTEIFLRYQRSEQAFLLALMEMVVMGVSTRKVTDITEQLCGASFSKSMVSALCAGLEVPVQGFNSRRLEGVFPFLLVDAMFFKSRENDRVVSRAALIVSGIRSDGFREVLGLRIGDTESFSTWNEMFRWLKDRGLHGTMFVISDAHQGLQEAIRKNFQGVTWQRCQVHLLRNILGSCGARHREDVARDAKRVLHASDLCEARRRLEEFRNKFKKIAPKSVVCLENGFEDAMAVMVLPEKYRKRLRSTNMQERMNQEIRRRERVIRIFPNDASAKRLIGALLLEQHETWMEKRYLDMGEFWEWEESQNESERKEACQDVQAG